MSSTRPKLARFHTVQYEQVMPIPIVIPFSYTAPVPIYPLPLPFHPQQELVVSPSVVPMEILSYPTANVPPHGTILANTTDTVPLGYLACDGSIVSRSTYRDLLISIGTYYGDGDGSTTFHLPNLYHDQTGQNPNVKYIIKV